MFFDHRGLLEGRERAPGARHRRVELPLSVPGRARARPGVGGRGRAALGACQGRGGRGAARPDARRERRRAGRAPPRSCGPASTRAAGCSRSATAARPPTRWTWSADFRLPHDPRWAPRRAIDLTEDAAILTAIANDIGTEAIFSRQVIAHGREGDALLAISTSGNSANVISALAEARRRGLRTIAMVGYDGGRVAGERLADHVVVTRSEHIPRIQEAQASAYHVLRELVAGCESRCARGWRARSRASASAPTSTGSRASWAWRVTCSTTRAAWWWRSRRRRRRSSASSSGWPRRRRRWPRRARGRPSRSRTPASAGFAIRESPRGGEPRAAVAPDSATCADCLAELFDPADRRFRYPFTNCTNCGPRFTIVRDVPYDRPHTTMAGFEMCAACRAEYEDPGDRRFHAQPNACPECGPRVTLVHAGGEPVRRGEARDAHRGRRPGAARRGDRRREGPGRLPSRLPRRATAAPWPSCAPASIARTSPSP